MELHELVKPNLHPALVHFPIGLLLVGTLIEVITLVFARRSTLRPAGRWMILLGTLLSLPIAATGVYAFKDVLVPKGEPLSIMWSDAVAGSPLAQDASAWNAMWMHLYWSAAASACALLGVFLFIAASPVWRRKLYVPALFLVIAASVCTGVTSYFGGSIGYDHGGGVQQASVETASTKDRIDKQINTIVPPVQLHVASAGLVFGVSIVALALSIHHLTLARGNHAGPGLNDLEAQAARGVRPPNRRVWIGVLVLALGTVAGGFYTLAHSADTYEPAKLWSQIVTDYGSDRRFTRLLAHLIVGSLFVVLPIAAIIMAKWFRQNRWLHATLALLLLLSIAGQTWLGTLMTWDTSHGNVTKFNP